MYPDKFRYRSIKVSSYFSVPAKIEFNRTLISQKVQFRRLSMVDGTLWGKVQRRSKIGLP